MGAFQDLSRTERAALRRSSGLFGDGRWSVCQGRVERQKARRQTVRLTLSLLAFCALGFATAWVLTVA